MSFKQGEAEWYNKFSEEFKDITWRKPFVHSSVGGVTSAGGMLSTAAAIISLLPPPYNCRILDAGCAEGHLAKMFSLTGYLVDGIDSCGKVINLAINNSTQWNGQIASPYLWCDDFDSIRGGEYDAIIFSDALHHSVNQLKTLDIAFSNLKPGGLLIANEPGIGHTKAAANWAEKYNVTEQSVIPWKLKRMAKKIGFTDIRFYPNPTTLHKSVYELEGLNHHPIVKLLCKFFGASLVSFAKPFHGLTTMRKPV